MERPYDDVREAFTEADARFKEALTSAFSAHTKCVALFLTTLERVERREADLEARIADIQESVEELRRLLLERGQQ